jgi:hypothetical protein
MDGLRKNTDKFVWDVFRTPDEVGASRMASMRRFLADFPQGKAAGRYITAGLPVLPFKDAQFDLALCSHFLFLYSSQLSYDFHRAAIFELCRVAREIRIFPIIMAELHAAGHKTELVQVPYEHQKGANKMMKIMAR